MADEPAGYTTGEKLAGLFGAILFLGLALIAVDLATGGRVFRPRKPCGCQDKDEVPAPEVGEDVSGP